MSRTTPCVAQPQHPAASVVRFKRMMSSWTAQPIQGLTEW